MTNIENIEKLREEQKALAIKIAKVELEAQNKLNDLHAVCLAIGKLLKTVLNPSGDFVGSGKNKVWISAYYKYLFIAPTSLNQYYFCKYKGVSYAHFLAKCFGLTSFDEIVKAL